MQLYHGWLSLSWHSPTPLPPNFLHLFSMSNVKKLILIQELWDIALIFSFGEDLWISRPKFFTNDKLSFNYFAPMNRQISGSVALHHTIEKMKITLKMSLLVLLVGINIIHFVSFYWRQIICKNISWPCGPMEKVSNDLEIDGLNLVGIKFLIFWNKF